MHRRPGTSGPALRMARRELRAEQRRRLVPLTVEFDHSGNGGQCVVVLGGHPWVGRRSAHGVGEE